MNAKVPRKSKPKQQTGPSFILHKNGLTSLAWHRLLWLENAGQHHSHGAATKTSKKDVVVHPQIIEAAMYGR
jgi:hypothetical protein